MLNITQYGVLNPDGSWWMGISVSPEDSCASCEWNGKTHSPLPNNKLLRIAGGGSIACVEPMANVLDGEKYVWYPLVDKDTEWAFTGETTQMLGMTWGKVWWD